ncbi:MurR/RpiR family transcriptional regulator [Allofournierella sp.]|uniref:MurR/RpiR family transcriptional regulator n=1 Tax=Allofournierella sp. TaxID=1940256 RepID=UPI003AB5D7E2
MPADFFERANRNLQKLSQGEKKIFDYVVRNLSQVKDMNIRELANACYVSTTTMFRFVKKLGFSGYGEFSSVLKLTDFAVPTAQIPQALWQKNYMSAYLKNINESVRVISQERLARWNALLDKDPTIYLVAEGLSRDVGAYTRRLLVTLGLRVVFPCEEFEVQSAIEQIQDRDLLLALSFSGKNGAVIRIIESVLAQKKPTVVSVTGSTNNPIQNLCDLDFYVFSDGLACRGQDITSRISMLAVVETMVYSRLVGNEVNLLPNL